MKIFIKPSSSFRELQKQLGEPNAVYVIEHEQNTFGTKENPLVFPEECTLEFCGGAFMGGYVLFNGLLQNDVIYPVWKSVNILYNFENYAYTGFRNMYLRPEWFGAIGNGETDDSLAIQQCITEARYSGSMVHLLSKRYLLKQTIYLYSGSHIEGCIAGSLDRNEQIGTSLVFDLPEESDVAIDLNSSVKDKEGQYIDRSGCYKFIIKRLGIINNKIATNIGLRLISSDEQPVPREGLVENVLVYNFGTGLLINALSYVKFSQICLIGYRTGIKINKIGLYIEFGWFHDVYMNTTQSDGVGLDIDSGNNLYFNEIDINDCKTGIWLHSEQPLFCYFFSRINLTRCGVCTAIEATKAFITRLKFSEVTLLYSECGFSFDRKGYYNIGDSSFVDMFDSVDTDKPLFWIKDNTLSLASCTFERIRALGRIRGLAYAGKLNLVNYSPSGEFVMRAGLQSYIYVVESRSVFDFVPSVISECSDKTLSYSISVENEQLGNLSIRINLESELTHDVVFKYLFHRLI